MHLKFYRTTEKVTKVINNGTEDYISRINYIQMKSTKSNAYKLYNLTNNFSERFKLHKFSKNSTLASFMTFIQFISSNHKKQGIYLSYWSPAAIKFIP